ncbi:hypothetical protein BDZ45DRAFT_808418 [Acephala macrosclerotiorum]|nr:hypothetical protein BDZ45DRAFT_808418 [Acephala macrosclerotiorum]
MKIFTDTSLLALATLGSAQPPFDPSGGINVGNGVGGQFIGGQCIQDSDCATQCCANPTGICSTVDTSTSLGKTGCGFPSGSGPETTGPSTGPIIDPSGAANFGNGVGAQLVGGECLSGADCASSCCAGPSGICSGVDASTEFGKTGCGHMARESFQPQYNELDGILQEQHPFLARFALSADQILA